MQNILDSDICHCIMGQLFGFVLFCFLRSSQENDMISSCDLKEFSLGTFTWYLRLLIYIQISVALLECLFLKAIYKLN